MFHQSSKQILLGIFVTLLLITMPVYAIKYNNYKISDYGGGHQIWFEAEDYDERNPDTDQYFPVVDAADAFGQAITRAGGAGGMIRWTFDISAVDGKRGTWYFWGRVINPSNQSDFMLVEGHPGDPQIPTGPPFPGTSSAEGFTNAHRVFEEDIGPPWEWARSGHGEAHTKELQDGENTMYILHRQGNDTVFWDVFMWTDSPGYVPTDEDYQNARIGLGFGPVSGPYPANGAIHEDTWVSLSWRPGDFAVSHDVYLSENFADVDAGITEAFQGNQTLTEFTIGFPGFAYPDGLIPGTTYYWRIDEVNDLDPNSPWKGDVWSFSIPPKTAYFPEPTDGAESVNLNAKLRWTGGFDAKLHYVYFGDNFDDVNNAVGGLPQGTETYTPGPLKLAETYYWRVDESDIIETHKGNVWSFTTQGAVQSLDPSNGTVDVKQTAILTWSPSVYATSHQIYFGTDKDTVRNADIGSPEYKGTRDLGDESYDPGMLEWDTTYYWRVDEVNNANTDSPWIGLVWSFTTANFLIIDDMESYNDIDEGEPGSNRIYLAWVDGFDNPTTNGSVVGDPNGPPFAELTIVHSGNQSMPYIYNNAVGKSEATLTLTSNRDWTVNGVNRLTIWFRGSSSNAAEQMYVVLNDSAVVTHDNPDAALTRSWTEWNIDLQVFADQGVDLANVNTIALGLGDRNNPQAGGSGMMYFDDIRLYRPAPEPAP